MYNLFPNPQIKRARKRLDPNRQAGNNHPTNAYLIMGHGKEISKAKFIVPPGCMIVVDVHSGEISYGSTEEEFFKEPKDIFLNPIDNYNDVVKRISTVGSVAIYREGDEYPDFVYKLVSYWTHSLYTPDIDVGQYELADSGIVQYPFTYIEPKYTEVSYDKDSDPDVFINRYRMSIFPTTEQIIDGINNVQIFSANESSRKVNNKKLSGIGEIVDNLTNYPLRTLFKIRQSQLFEKVLAGELEPGIFYNVACRGTSYTARTKSAETGRLILDPRLQLSYINRNIFKNNSNNLRVTRKNNFFAPEITGRISEAELIRKRNIYKLKLNTRNRRNNKRNTRNNRNNSQNNGRYTKRNLNNKWIKVNNNYNNQGL